MEEKELVDLAINWVCPNTGFPHTPYEIEMVDNLIRFGQAVLRAAEHPAPADGAISAPDIDDGHYLDDSIIGSLP